MYFDGILVAGTTVREHTQHLHQLFGHLSEQGLVINASMCLFSQRYLDFLGHRISLNGSLPLPVKVDAISNFPQPTIVKCLQEFVGG